VEQYLVNNHFLIRTKNKEPRTKTGSCCFNSLIFKTFHKNAQHLKIGLQRYTLFF